MQQADLGSSHSRIGDRACLLVDAQDPLFPVRQVARVHRHAMVLLGLALPDEQPPPVLLLQVQACKAKIVFSDNWDWWKPAVCPICAGNYT